MSENLVLEEIADRFRCSTRTIKRWVAKKAFPEPFRVGLRLLWPRQVIEEFAARTSNAQQAQAVAAG